MPGETTAPQEQRSESHVRRRDVVLLGMPTLGLALAITMISTYAPKVAAEFTSSTVVIGVIIGGEGLMAVWVPLIAGSWSDRLRTRFGGRLPFMMVATPPMVIGLLLVGVVGSLLGLALVVGLFFLAYFVAYEPYRALYPDVVPEQYAGRAQSIQALWRGAGTGIALVTGGVMLAAGQFVPFVVAAVAVGGTVAVFTWLTLRRGRVLLQQEVPDEGPVGLAVLAGQLRRIITQHRGLRAYLLANALWELSLGALKTFVVLYITQGLGHSLGTASEVIGFAAIFIIAAAAVSGRLGDKMGMGRVLEASLWFYGLTLLIPFITTNETVELAAVPFIAFAGGVIMTLPYALLIPMMPEHEHGALTGFYSLSRGLGTTLGPLLGGVAISAFSDTFDSTQGYQAMWLVCSLAILASIVFLRRMRSARAEQEAAPQSV